jgi:hypothetical protein
MSRLDDSNWRMKMSDRRKRKKKVVGYEIDFGLIHAAIEEALRASSRLEEDAFERGELLRRDGHAFIRFGNFWLEKSHSAMLQTAKAYLFMAGTDVDFAVLERAWAKIIAADDDFAPDAKWASAIRRAIDTEKGRST